MKVGGKIVLKSIYVKGHEDLKINMDSSGNVHEMIEKQIDQIMAIKNIIDQQYLNGIESQMTQEITLDDQGSNEQADNSHLTTVNVEMINNNDDLIQDCLSSSANASKKNSEE